MAVSKIDNGLQDQINDLNSKLGIAKIVHGSTTITTPSTGSATDYPIGNGIVTMYAKEKQISYGYTFSNNPVVVASVRGDVNSGYWNVAVYYNGKENCYLSILGNQPNKTYTVDWMAIGF